EVVVRWGLRIGRDFPAGTSNTVLLYEKNVPTKGGPVVMGDGGFRMMTAEEFKQSPLPVTEKERHAAQALLKAQVEKIVSGKSERKEVKVRDRTLKAGDTAPARDGQRFTVMNASPVASGNSRFSFGHTGLTTAESTVSIIGFTDDGQRALVEYTLPKGRGAAGTLLPTGVRFFLSVEEFAQWRDENAARNTAKREARANLKEQVRKIIEGKSRLQEVALADRVLRVGDTAPVSKWEWVEVMNLTPVQSTNQSFVFREEGDFDTCGVNA